MRLETALYTSSSAISAFGSAMAVLGDNVANAGTVGFKRSRVEFADLVPEGLNGRQSTASDRSGSGVATKVIRPIHDSGVIEYTGRDLDVGVAGTGLFVIGSVDNQLYTRAGNFEINNEGLLSTTDGRTVLGYQGTSTTLSTVNLRDLEIQATATSAIAVSGNLDSQSSIATVPTSPTAFSDIADAANFTTSVRAVDSLGAEHNILLAFYKTAANQWTAQAYIDGEDVGGTAGVPTQVGQNASMTFNSSGGIDTANLADVVISGQPSYSNGAAQGSFTINLGTFNQFAGVSQVVGITNDGLGTGNIQSYDIQRDGKIYAQLDSGEPAFVGTIALADFDNLDGLSRVGSNSYQATENVGNITISTPSASGLGETEGGSLELSTVDLATEFTAIIFNEKAYQANSSALKTVNRLLDEANSLAR